MVDRLMGDGTETILLYRIGDESCDVQMAELTDKELADLLRDCQEEMERRKIIKSQRKLNGWKD